MKKILKYFNLFLLVSIMLFTTSCNENNNKPNDDNNVQEETIGKKSELMHLDFILFTINKVGLSYQDLEGNDVCVIEVKIDQNFNEQLKIETDYSKYINKIVNENKNLKFIVSPTYNKYLKVGDSFIYKLDDTSKIKVNNEIEEVYTTINNEYTLLPVSDGNVHLANITSNISHLDEPDYAIDTLILQRDVYYGYDLEGHLIEFDYSNGYRDYYNYFLDLKPTVSRFKDMLTAISNENEDFFYKLKYSRFAGINLLDSELITIVDEYLTEMGGK